MTSVHGGFLASRVNRGQEKTELRALIAELITINNLSSLAPRFNTIIPPKEVDVYSGSDVLSVLDLHYGTIFSLS